MQEHNYTTTNGTPLISLAASETAVFPADFLHKSQELQQGNDCKDYCVQGRDDKVQESAAPPSTALSQQCISIVFHMWDL